MSKMIKKNRQKAKYTSINISARKSNNAQKYK